MRNRRIRLMLIAFLLLFPLFPVYRANAMESTCPSGLMATATLIRGETALTVYGHANMTEKLGSLKKGVTCRITGAGADCYRISFDGIEGYALKSKLKLSGRTSDQPYACSAVTDLALEQYLYNTPNLAKTMAIHGMIQTDVPLDTLFFFLWDERLQQMEQAVVKEVSRPAAKLDIGDVCKTIEFPAMSAGRKTLLIQGMADGRPVYISRMPVYVCGNFKAIRNINDRCKFSAGKNQEDLAGRKWTPTADKKTLTITLPADGSAVLMTIEWRLPAESFSLAFLDDHQQKIAEETKTTGFYADTVAFPAGTRQVQLSMTGKDNWVRNLCVYDANHPDNTVQQWQPLPEKLDLMVFSPHQDDELLFYGGAIPYACRRGADVGVVYMTYCGRSRYGEALDGLWTAGLRTHPIFLNWQDQWGFSVNHALNSWIHNGVNPQREVVRLMRQYKPEVIVGPDPEGEYGHAQHKLTSKLISDAVPLAMDESFDPESARAYGVWEVKKVYLHLYGENRIEMDWDTPFSPDSPISPIFLAKEAFDKHRSQQEFKMDKHGKISDNRVFGLFYTAVGPDEAKNDIFEHIALP